MRKPRLSSRGEGHHRNLVPEGRFAAATWTPLVTTPQKDVPIGIRVFQTLFMVLSPGTPPQGYGVPG